MLLDSSQSATSLQLSVTGSTATWVYWSSCSQDTARPERTFELAPVVEVKRTRRGARGAARRG